MTSEEIINILRDKKATLPCPACGHDGFTLLEGDFAQDFIAWGKPRRSQAMPSPWPSFN